MLSELKHYSVAIWCFVLNVERTKLCQILARNSEFHQWMLEQLTNSYTQHLLKCTPENDLCMWT